MTYPGGKNGSGVYQKLINLIPPHALYVEAFLGGGAVLRLKKPAAGSIGIDSDGDVISQFPSDAVPNLQLLNTDALAWLANTALSDDTFVYCDPPYLMSTRSTQRAYYRHEFADEAQHCRLLDVLRGLKCMVMVSGYHSQLYANALPGWRTATFTATTRGGRKATEWVWMNYPEPFELHDYQYLGDNFRQRERIRRKQRRWRARLLKMPNDERYALLETITDLRIHSPQMAVSSNTSPELTVRDHIAESDGAR